MLNLEWWQALVAIFAALGLSPAPWIVALLTGRLVTRTIHLERMADKAAENERVSRDRDYEREAKALQEKRADTAVAALSSVANEMGQTTVHLLKSLPGVGDEA